MTKLRSDELNGISGITADSRAVRPGFMFAALPGAAADGRLFIGDAVSRGAAAVLAPLGTLWPAGVPPRPLFLHATPRARLAALAVELAGPMPKTLVAVTGTNGKTSTVDFLRQILVLAQRPAASIGTLGVIATGLAPRDSLTTPDPVLLADTLAMLARHGIADVAMEASSHGLQQCRLDGLQFAAAGFTNLTRDHLDYHGDMAAYREAKLRLALLVAPGGTIRAMADIEPDTGAALRRICAGRGVRYADVRIDRTVPGPGGQSIFADGRELQLNLPGRFQADNAMLAAALAGDIGVREPHYYLPRLQGVRGRLEQAVMLGNGAAAYVDYAHTPDAVALVLMALRPHAQGRLVIVFGAGGNRDAGKRPLMGEAAARLADVAIITDDNPRNEDPALIRAAILQAAPGAIEIAGRRAAIAAGLALLREGDVLVVAGKGHEQGQIIGGEVIPFDDVAVIRELAGAA